MLWTAPTLRHRRAIGWLRQNELLEGCCARRALQEAEAVADGVAVSSIHKVVRNWRTRSFRGSGEPARVNASSNAWFGLGPDPRRALGPAAIRAASTGRTHDRTRPMLHQRKKKLLSI